MQRLLRRIWQWLKSLLGLEKSLDSRKTFQETSPVLADGDYEFLFMQLLEGVAHGWHEGRVLKFFQRLQERGRQRPWVDWLQRFGDKVLANPSPNQQLAVRMIRLGELAQAFPEIEQIGTTSYAIGRDLYFRNSAEVIWEYSGEDTPSSDSPEVLSPQEPGVQTLSMDELYQQLQQNSELAVQIAEQLGLDTEDPTVIVEALVQQFKPIDPENPPETIEDWFQTGLHYAGNSDWERAIESWDKALAIDPDLAQALHNRASALGMLGKFSEALPSFERALELEPTDFQIWNGKGSALYSLNRWQEALECWDESLNLKTDFYQGWYNRGCTLENMGDISGAIASFQKALEIQPDFALAQSKLKQLS